MYGCVETERHGLGKNESKMQSGLMSDAMAVLVCSKIEIHGLKEKDFEMYGCFE